MNKEQIEKLIEVLEVGRDAAHEVAQRFHEEMKGYREAEHKQVDKDVADLNEAIAMLEVERALLVAAPNPAVALEPWAPSEEQFEQWRARHGLHHSHNEAFYDAASLYLEATPPALAGSQVQAAGDALDAWNDALEKAAKRGEA